MDIGILNPYAPKGAIKDENNNFIFDFVNDAAEKSLNYKPGKLIRMKLKDLLTEKSYNLT